MKKILSCIGIFLVAVFIFAGISVHVASADAALGDV
jgi:hypothetical protein